MISLLVSMMPAVVPCPYNLNLELVEWSFTSAPPESDLARYRTKDPRTFQDQPSAYQSRRSISALVGLQNVLGHKHQPPYCINSRRVYDMVAVFGILKHNDLRRSVVASAATPRSIASSQHCVHYSGNNLLEPFASSRR